MDQRMGLTEVNFMPLGHETAQGLARNLGNVARDSTPESTIGIGVDLAPEDVLGLAMRYDLRQIVQKSSCAMETELRTSAVMLKEPLLFLKYPLSAIFAPDRIGHATEESLSKFSIGLFEGQDRDEILEAFDSYIATILHSQWLQGDAFLVADELVANAQIHGKVASGVSSLTVGHDQDRIVICVKDGGGTLDFNRLVESVNACYTRLSANGIFVDQERESAEIGSYFVYNACVSYYGGAIKDEATVVCCALPMRRDRQGITKVPKNLHLTPKRRA